MTWSVLGWWRRRKEQKQHREFEQWFESLPVETQQELEDGVRRAAKAYGDFCEGIVCGLFPLEKR
jgi:hypothetical protein